jgi:uncharacterized membrane protein YkvA (DUF1232 family)
MRGLHAELRGVPVVRAEEGRMMHSHGARWSRKWWLSPCVVVAACGVLLTCAATCVAAVRVAWPTVEVGLHAVTAAAPGFDGRLHRVATRAEHTLGRLGAALTTGIWILVSAALFLVVAAIASAADVRMLQLRQHRARAVVRDLGHGVRIFFRVLGDRQTLYAPRTVLALALVYWLLPLDLVDDGIQGVGMLDDVVIAVVAAKVFIRLCPDAVVEAHAAAVQTET